jgi:hypothetical protein
MTAWEAILGGLIGVLAGMLANELFAWQPRLARWILEKAVQRTPEAMQARLREEWQADLATIPGKLSGVVFAASLFWKARSIAGPRTIWDPLPEEWLCHGDAAIELCDWARAHPAGQDHGRSKMIGAWVSVSIWVGRKSVRRLGYGTYGAIDRVLLKANGFLLIRYTKSLQNRGRDSGRNP